MIAVLLVVQCHLFFFFGNPTYWGVVNPNLLGRYGVTLFFIHTAVVLMASMERQWRRSQWRRFYLIFLVRRGFRIFPLAIVVLAATVLLAIPGEVAVHHARSIPFDGVKLLANFSLMQNVVTGSSIVGTYWSLPYEWQMYLVLPLFYVLARRISTMTPVLMIWVAPVLVSMSYAGRIDQFNRNRSIWKIPIWHVYAPCFIAGILVFVIATKAAPRPTLPAITIPIAIAALGVPMMATPTLGKFAPATLLLALTIPYCREMRVGWLTEAARVVVRYSYGIYLVHLPAITVSFHLLRDWPRVAQWALFSALVIVLPVALYHALEHPAIRLGNRIAARLEARPSPRMVPALADERTG